MGERQTFVAHRRENACGRCPLEIVESRALLGDGPAMLIAARRVVEQLGHRRAFVEQLAAPIGERDLGAGPWTTFRLVTFPMIFPGVLAGSLLALTGPHCKAWPPPVSFPHPAQGVEL
jgi:hypothetical protein